MALAAILVATPVLATGGKFSKRKLKWSLMPKAQKDCVCLYVQCYPPEIQAKIKEFKKAKNKICTAKSVNGDNGSAFAVTEWDPRTGKITGIAILDLPDVPGPGGNPPNKNPDFFNTKPWLKKSTIWQEFNRVLAGGFYRVPRAALFGQNREQAQCAQAYFEAINNGLTHARDAASRSTFASVTDPGPDAAGNDNITEQQWCNHVNAELKAAEDRLDKARAEKKTARGKKGGLGNLKAADQALVDQAFKQLCWEIKAAARLVAAAKAKKGG